jgi:predicted dehydrogenase
VLTRRALIASPILAAADTSPRKVRIGIVGGRFGLTFQFQDHPDCIVEAVSDLRPERLAALAKTYRCSKTYPSLAELLRDPKIEAVCLFTDAPLHVEQASLALQHGKHVLSAVPAAWATLDQCHALKDAVTRSGLSYMMAETSWYRQSTISARQLYRQGKFGEIYYSESEYHHDGLESLYFENGVRTWRYGVAPMHYPTHCTAFLTSITGERFTEVSCHGWGDDSPILKDNAYGNPYWNQTALLRTDKGHSHRLSVWWKGAHKEVERAQWFGTKMSLATAGWNPATAVYHRDTLGKDDAGFAHRSHRVEAFPTKQWWQTDLLPEPLRKNSGHDGSHAFLTHEFIDALSHRREPLINLRESLAMTAPGIVAHQSALKGGELLKIPSFD